MSQTRASVRCRAGRTGVVFLAVGIVLLVQGCRRVDDDTIPAGVDAQAVGATNSSQRDARARKPNVLLVVLDTTRADALTCYGGAAGATPNIDRLALDGARYTHAFSTCFWTLPAHASLFTGLYPTQAQATSETNRLPLEVATLAEVMRDDGYHTGAVVCNPWITEDRGFAQGFQTFIEAWRRIELVVGGLPAGLTEQLAVDEATRWLDAQAAETEPFFLFVNFNVPHLPYLPPPEFVQRFIARPVSVGALTRLNAKARVWAVLAGAVKLTADDHTLLRQLYRGEVAVADAQVGLLLAKLRALGLLDDTVVVLTSDHGENIGDHGLIDHVLSMYDTTIRVPLIVRYPPRWPQNTVRDELVSLVDIAPTILDVCGVARPDQWSVSDAMSLCSAQRSTRPYVVAENDRPLNGVQLLRTSFPDFDVASIDRRMRMWRTRTHKLVWREDAGVELYDLVRDPAELGNVAAEQAQVRDRLLEDLLDWLSATQPVVADVAPPGAPDDEAQQRLRSLGYVE